MNFRLPLTAINPKYPAFLESIKAGGPISFYRERRALLLLADDRLNVTPREFDMAEFIVPQAEMTSAARTFGRSGFIDKCRPYRMIADEYYNAETTAMHYYPGHPCFAICFSAEAVNNQTRLALAFSELLQKLQPI